MNKVRKFLQLDSVGQPIDTDGRVIEHCIEQVPDGGRFITAHTCGRKLRGDTEFPYLCWIHVAAIHRARTKSGQREALKVRRQAELETAGAELAALNSRLEICSTLRTSMPTTGPGAFIGVPTGEAIVRIDQLEKLAYRIAELETQVEDLKMEAGFRE